MKLELTDFKNESKGRKFQVSKFIFESLSLYKKWQSLRFPSEIHIIFNIYIYFQPLFYFILK
jgi:hypothetical protein